MASVDLLNPARIEQAVRPDTDGETTRARFAWLDAADVIFLVPEWDAARESCMEYGYAMGAGKPIQMLSEEAMEFVAPFHGKEDTL